MCGILGIIGPNSSNFGLRFVRDSLAHRGPDSQDFFLRDNVYLAHSRLSIIDPLGGAQPMRSHGDKFVITFNGEIYNFKIIKYELERFGYSFKTNSDTEVVLSAYEHWGAECLHHLRGMFAFAIADHEKKKLFIARDHLGIKPLVYSYSGGHFSFASEIQSLTALQCVKADLEPDLQAIYELLRFAYTSAPRTAYKQIFKLQPAHFLEIDLKSPTERKTPQRYWQLTHNPDETLTPNDCLELVDEAVRESVKAHLVADVPFGAFLSGGLDSTLVVSYMSEILDEPVRSFSIGFNESAYDERHYARLAAQTLGTQHYEEIVTGDALDLVPKLVQHYGEPFGDSSAIPTWHVSRLARTKVPMVLSGDGGDEFFGGYNSYRSWLSQMAPGYCDSRQPKWMILARAVLSLILPNRYPPKPKPPKSPLERWINIAGFYKEHQLTPLLRKEFCAAIHRQPQPMQEALRSVQEQPALTQARTIDIYNYLPADILTKVDIASMMHGLEVRTPLTDIRIAELSGRIPWHCLMEDRGGSQNWTGKLPIRSVLARRFDHDFIDRPKQGFGIPVREWLFSDPQKAKLLYERLLSPSARLQRWLQPSGIKSILDQQLGYQTWHLMVLEEWLEQNRF